MKFKVVSKPLNEVPTEALAVIFDDKGPIAATGHPAFAEHVSAFGRALSKKTTSREWFCTLDPKAGASMEHLLLDSAGFGPYAPGDEKLKTAGARAASICRDYSLTKIAFAVDRDDAPRLAAALYEGVCFGDFADQNWKSKPSERKELEVTFAVPASMAKPVEQALSRTHKVMEGVVVARRLVNGPNNEITPAVLTGTGAQIARKFRMKHELLNEREIKKQGYELLWNVGRGSEHQPRMLTISYVPRKPRTKLHVCIVGKGMTFDTGGYCIKDRANMFKMNNDMGGAAAVIGAMQAIGALQLPMRVTAIVPSAHNAIDAAAYHPGAIIKSKNGKTVFIGNTDAEGRLILADAFERAKKEKPDVLIDLATLTGACVMALGPRLAGLFSDDAALRETISASGAATGDSVWPMPIWREYEHELNHALADLNNITRPGAEGGAIHAANFLRQFVPEGVRWAHVDIAGVAVAEGRARYYSPGATGFGVRLIVETLTRLAEK